MAKHKHAKIGRPTKGEGPKLSNPDEVERLLHAGGGVHRVAGDHGLHDHRVTASDDDTAAGGIADAAGVAAALALGAAGVQVVHASGRGKEVARAIEQDPGLCTRLLTAANSPKSRPV